MLKSDSALSVLGKFKCDIVVNFKNLFASDHKCFIPDQLSSGNLALPEFITNNRKESTTTSTIFAISPNVLTWPNSTRYVLSQRLANKKAILLVIK